MAYANSSEISQAKRIGDTIKEHLKLSKKSQKDLSKESGIPETTISSYVRGISVPNSENLSKICTALDISLDLFNSTLQSETTKVSLQSVSEYLDKLTRTQFIKWIDISSCDFNIMAPIDLIMKNLEDNEEDNPISKEDMICPEILKISKEIEGDERFILRETISNERARSVLKDIETYARLKIEEYINENAFDDPTPYLK